LEEAFSSPVAGKGEFGILVLVELEGADVEGEGAGTAQFDDGADAVFPGEVEAKERGEGFLDADGIDDVEGLKVDDGESGGGI
jgi:hypothetical protein